jgi:hypothetical protein
MVREPSSRWDSDWRQHFRGSRNRSARAVFERKERKVLTQQKWDEVFLFENLISPKFTR